MRLAQISDLHFGSFTLNPFQFLSKRWLGNFNFLFTRKKKFSYNRLIELIDLFKAEKVTHVLITGDLSITSRSIEFKMGKRFIELLKKEGLEVFAIPGNHDHYTRRSDRKKRFYKFFDPQFDPDCPLNLKDDKVTYIQLDDQLWLVALDTAMATGPTSSQGYFSPKAQESLEKALKAIPSYASVILLNHFPFFHNELARKDLVRAPLLKNLLTKYPNIILYLHGHTHRQTIADLRPSQLPIISDVGSTPHIEYGACHLFEFGDNAIQLDTFHYDDGWKPDRRHSFTI